MYNPQRGHPGEPRVLFHFQVVGVLRSGGGEGFFEQLQGGGGEHFGAVLRRLAGHRHRATRGCGAHVRARGLRSAESIRLIGYQ